MIAQLLGGTLGRLVGVFTGLGGMPLLVGVLALLLVVVGVAL